MLVIIRTSYFISGHWELLQGTNIFQTDDPSKVMTGPDESLQSHLLCFLAERARKENKVVNVEEENRDHL